jgi:predicted DsbA family dithiol-disulfide isomerase
VKKPVQLEIFSDVICPWCYIGTQRLDPAVEKFRADGGSVDLRYRPFLLHPDMTGPSRPLTEYLTDRFGPRAAGITERVRSIGAEVGLELRFDIAVAASTLLAHQLMEAAYDHGGYEAQRRMADQLWVSHFTRGEDIADIEILTEAGTAAGLPDDVIANALADPARASQVRAGLSEAQELGVSAVPTFVADRNIGVQGAQPAEALFQLMSRARALG